MKIRIIFVLGTALLMAAIVIGWKFVAATGATYDKHAYNGIYNSGIGHPYQEFISELRKIAESGDTNRLMTVLRRAESTAATFTLFGFMTITTHIKRASMRYLSDWPNERTIALSGARVG